MTDIEPIVPIEGHDQIVERFRQSLLRGRLGSSYLFVGPAGVGKRSFARWLAQTLLCSSTAANALEACGICPDCQQVAAATHPDFDYVAKPEEKSTIPVELLIGDKAHRMREGLCPRIAMTPARGGRRVAIIDDADYLSQEAANCLLKTLEEPPPRTVLILIGTSAQRQLPTIRSRCQIINFRPLSSALLRRLAMEQELVAGSGPLDRIVSLSDGSLDRVRQFATPEVAEFCEELSNTFGALNWKPLTVVREVTEFVDAAGKEAPKRRERLTLVADLATRHFQQALHVFVKSATGEAASPQAAELAAAWPLGAEELAALADRSLVARQHVAANANQATNIEAWIDELWSISHPVSSVNRG